MDQQRTMRRHRAAAAATPRDGAIIVVAKCPIRGKSKTRLIPLLGEDGSVDLARGMLSDVLLTLEHCEALSQIHKILLYAPGNDVGLDIMRGILKELNLSESMPSNERLTNKCGWKLMPMQEGDLSATDLGGKLEDALLRGRQYAAGNGGVVFLGMDAPVLSLDDIVTGLCNASTSTEDKSRDQESSCSSPHIFKAVAASAMLCPADDGGYGMLCVPPDADPSRTFRDLYWSHPLTAISQVKALTDQNIKVNIGKVMNDIDEPSDVKALCKRLAEGDEDEGKNLNSHSGGHFNGQITCRHPSCHHTRKALKTAGFL